MRRQGALATGRIGDAAGVDLLFPVLNDTVPGVHIQTGVVDTGVVDEEQLE